jgi:hypothetical protein
VPADLPAVNAHPHPDDPRRSGKEPFGPGRAPEDAFRNDVDRAADEEQEDDRRYADDGERIEMRLLRPSDRG